MKVKIILVQYFDDLEWKVNDFIKGKKVIDIKYSMTCKNDYLCGSAMIIYEEN